MKQDNTKICILVDSLGNGYEYSYKTSENIKFISLFKAPLNKISIKKVKNRLDSLVKREFNKKNIKLVFIQNSLAYNYLMGREHTAPISDSDTKIRRNNKYVAISHNSVYDAYLYSKLLLKKKEILNGK